MGMLMKIDGSKVEEELKSAERSLKYWKNLEDKHPKGNTFFKEEIARASARIEVFKFVLCQCPR